MARYTAVLAQATVSTSYKTMGALWTISGSLRRLSVYELDLGLSGALNTSNDTQVLFNVSRFTTTSLLSGTAFTTNPLDSADPAALSLYNNLIVTEFAALTANSSLLNPPINQRGTFRWRALDDGDNLIIPATTQAGIAVQALSLSYTGTAIGTIMYIE